MAEFDLDPAILELVGVVLRGLVVLAGHAIDGSLDVVDLYLAGIVVFRQRARLLVPFLGCWAIGRVAGQQRRGSNRHS
jgi:hypothetical protein